MKDWHETPPPGLFEEAPSDELIPFPDVFDPGEKPWEIGVGQGATSKNERKMFVPLGSTGQEKLVRLREALYAKYTPDFTETMERYGATWKLDPTYLRVAEEARINAIQAYLGYPVGPTCSVAESVVLGERTSRLASQTDKIAALVKVWGDRRLRNAILRKLRLSDRRDVKAMARGLIESHFPEVAGVPPFTNTLSLAQWFGIHKRAEEAAAKEAAERKAKEKAAAEEEAARAAKGKGNEPSEEEKRLERDGYVDQKGLRLNRHEEEQVQQLLKKFAQGQSPPIINGSSRWGEMTIHDAPLSRKVKMRKTARHKRAEEEGVVPEKVYNFASSGKMFVEKRRELGGSILLDCSGSMSLSQEDVMRLVDLAPALLIAGYAGFSSSGRLRVFVRSGMRVEDDLIGSPAGGGNVVDGPALEWLSRQKEPRMWISDGDVTGLGDGSITSLRSEVAAICRQFRIKRVLDIETALTILLSRKLARGEAA